MGALRGARDRKALRELQRAFTRRSDAALWTWRDTRPTPSIVADSGVGATARITIQHGQFLMTMKAANISPAAERHPLGGRMTDPDHLVERAMRLIRWYSRDLLATGDPRCWGFLCLDRSTARLVGDSAGELETLHLLTHRALSHPPAHPRQLDDLIARATELGLHKSVALFRHAQMEAAARIAERGDDPDCTAAEAREYASAVLDAVASIPGGLEYVRRQAQHRLRSGPAG